MKKLLLLAFGCLIALPALTQTVRWTSYMETPLITGTKMIVNDSTVAQLYVLEAKPGYTYAIQEIAPAIEVQATDFFAQSGVIVSGDVLGGVDRDDWVQYKLTLPGTTSTFEYTYAMADATAGAVEFRIGSVTAVPIAKAVLPVTGGWGNFVTLIVPVTPPYTTSGAIDLFVTFKESVRATGSGGNIRKIAAK